VLPSGTAVPIHATLVQEGPNQTGRDAATIGGGAAGGAILGNLLGKGGGKASVVGAIVGAIAGAAVASRTGKEEVVIPEGTVLGVKLDDDLAVQARARPDNDRPRPD
jgi:outer membrane lipoprotein SlyB